MPHVAFNPSPKTIGNYAKAISGAVSAGFAAAVSALADGNITAQEWTGIAVTFLIAAGAVYAVPNFPSAARSYAKAITAGLVGGFGSLGIALTDGGVSSAEWLTIAIAVLVGAGLVGAVPNAAYSSDVTAPVGSESRDVDLTPPANPRDLDGDGRDDSTGRFLPRA